MLGSWASSLPLWLASIESAFCSNRLFPRVPVARPTCLTGASGSMDFGRRAVICTASSRRGWRILDEVHLCAVEKLLTQTVHSGRS